MCIKKNRPCPDKVCVQKKGFVQLKFVLKTKLGIVQLVLSKIRLCPVKVSADTKLGFVQLTFVL